MKSNCCINNLLKFISVLQDNSIDAFSKSNSCTNHFLGPSVFCKYYNTRVITLYNRNGLLFTADFFNNNLLQDSHYFRIQNIDGNCCTLLILDYNDGKFISTKQTIVINTNCIAAVKCIKDVNITVL